MGDDYVDTLTDLGNLHADPVAGAVDLCSHHTAKAWDDVC